MTIHDFLTFLRPTLSLEVCTTRQLAMLGLLAEAAEPMDFGAVAKNLQLSKPALSRGLDTLERNGFVGRTREVEACREDRRRLFVVITKSGRDFLEKMGVSVAASMRAA
jgi:DNA-binding MarR family transcriptional regulator